MEGWIKLHRKILNNDLWNDPTTFRLFILLILKAAHKDGVRIKDIELKRGQYIRSYSKLQEDLEYIEGRGYKKVSKSSITRSIKKLIKNNIVQVHETKHGTLFTIVNYEKYQGFDEHSENEHGTVHETNLERTWNELGTNLEPEQELKNLRIKEIYNTTSTTTGANEEKSKNDAIVFYEQNIGMIRPAIADEMLSFINDYGDELVIEALKRAISRNKANWGYAKSILQAWARKGIKTLEQAKAEEVEFQNQQQSRRPSSRPQKKDVLPKWYIEQKQREEQEKHQQQPKEKQEDLEKIKKEVEEYFKKHRNTGG
mgnify:CR=1 FL=1